MESSPAVLTTCRRCGAHIIRATAEGIPVTTDAGPLDIPAEIDALGVRRDTYDLMAMGTPRYFYLRHRNLFVLAKPRRYPVVADHRCPPDARAVFSLAPAVTLTKPYMPPLPKDPPF